MKIALFSLFQSPNYGAILQSYALQEHLKDLGFESMYIPYSRNDNQTLIKRLRAKTSHFVSILFGYGKREEKTHAFRHNYLSIAKNCDLSPYSVFLVGSDQVWRPQLADATNDWFLLPFDMNTLKVSYSSSFGISDLPDSYEKRYRLLLSKFSHLSVREKEGLVILSKLGISNVSRVCDPTFLLDADKWKTLVGKRIIRDNYVFCYVMTGDISTANYINQVAKEWASQQKEKYRIIIVGDREYRALKPNYDLICDAGPIEFLNYMYYASYVITSSFHGTCFSLIFEKKFISVLNPVSPYNNRLLSLHSVFKLENRLVYTNSKGALPSLPCDLHSNIQMIIKQEKERADKYLMDSLVNE